MAPYLFVIHVFVSSRLSTAVSPSQLLTNGPYDHPDFMNAVGTIFTRARNCNVGAGIHFTGDVAKQLEFLNAGCKLIHCADISLFARALRKDLRAIKATIGDVDSSADDAIQI